MKHRNCLNCLKKFIPTIHINRQKYCSYKCRRQVWDKINPYLKNWRLSHQKEIKKYYLDNRDYFLNKIKKYRQKNPELWEKKYREQKDHMRIKYKNDPIYRSKIIHRSNQRRYIKRGKTNLGFHSLKEWQKLKEKYNHCCAICGMKEPFNNQYVKILTEDHIIPLSKGGKNTIDNIQPLCFSCNSRKGNRI